MTAGEFNRYAATIAVASLVKPKTQKAVAHAARALQLFGF